MEGDSALLQAIGRIGYPVYDNADLVLMYLHLIVSALFPIYIGAHASLRRPSSARKEAKTDLEQPDKSTIVDDEEPETVIEGLSPSDAIMFPIMAAIILSGLYFLIMWLEDPALLNKFLGWYFSAIGVFGVGKLIGDSLNVGTTFVFPSIWSTAGKTYTIDSVKRLQFSSLTSTGALEEGSRSPLPGLLSKINLPKVINQPLWSLRSLVTEKYVFTGYIRGIGFVKDTVRFNSVVGLLVGLAAVVVYNITGKGWLLTNTMGFGFCYGTLQLMTPTTFWTGSLVLMGLFVYDIVMVFYTPLMITVATSLDVPIKLVFPGPGHDGMLGLGDVVLPGIMIALALRFDLYMFYKRQIAAQPDEAGTAISSTVEPQDNRPIYHVATGYWGERFWNSHWKRDGSEVIGANKFNGGAFPKTYFNASLVGYVLGMLVTLFVLNAYKHGQPALLYLVPGVLGSLWGTAFVRGEFDEMWKYSEDVTGEAIDVKKVEEKTDVQEEAKENEAPGEKKVLEQAKTEKVTRTETTTTKEDSFTDYIVNFSLSRPAKRDVI